MKLKWYDMNCCPFGTDVIFFYEEPYHHLVTGRIGHGGKAFVWNPIEPMGPNCMVYTKYQPTLWADVPDLPKLKE